MVVFTILTAPFSGMGQAPGNSEWVGVWHADVDGLPTGTLTLATDGGELGGTVVLDMVSKEDGTSYVIVRDPYVLVGPRIESRTLSFRVRINRPDGKIVIGRFSATLTGGDKASIHCTNCGSDAPVVALVREH